MKKGIPTISVLMDKMMMMLVLVPVLVLELVWRMLSVLSEIIPFNLC